MSSENQARAALTPEQVGSVSPTLKSLTKDVIVDDLWRRSALSLRDRSVVTVAALIARSQTIGMLHYFTAALDNGVTPREMSEIVTHLAFYSGWSNAFSAIAVLKDIFAERGIGVDQLPAAEPDLLPLDEVAEAKRATNVQESVGPVSPGLMQYTGDILFKALWLRPDLSPRDRSLVTVSALVASGQIAQITFHLNRAMDNGLTAEQAGEVLTHLAFYSGWPNAMSAVPVVKDVLNSRSR